MMKPETIYKDVVLTGLTSSSKYWKVKVKLLSLIWLFAILWTVAYRLNHQGSTF